jgi:hypothetical protein
MYELLANLGVLYLDKYVPRAIENTSTCEALIHIYSD